MTWTKSHRTQAAISRANRYSRLRGWTKVTFAADLPLCECCGEEPWCPKHKKHFADCACVGPTHDGHEYKEVRGVLYARRTGKADE